MPENGRQPRERDVFFWAISSSKRDRGRAIEVSVGDDTTDEHMGGDDSKIPPGDGTRVRKSDADVLQ